MAFSVPLINPVTAVIYRLDIQGTWQTDPPGDADKGYDYLLREPVVSRSGATRTVTRAEFSPIRVPCQVEVLRFEELQATFGGNDPVTDIALVLHRNDLRALGLLDVNNNCILKPGDRIGHIENGNRVVRTFQEPLYVYEVRPRSWGFGEDGYDLEIVYTTYRYTTGR